MIDMVEKISEAAKIFRIVTPILLMLLTGILTFTGTVVTAYLQSITKSMDSISSDLKMYMKESKIEIIGLDKRVTVLETKANKKLTYAVSEEGE